ncbi:D-alanyl-D-alanine carboxypeptidase family protein [Microbacterium sp.]|uniref:M15 family metallopeptidase n=1 Tax=Microbacterium sp. TaxID=51671 RepID=UPI003736E200
MTAQRNRRASIALLSALVIGAPLLVATPAAADAASPRAAVSAAVEPAPTPGPVATEPAPTPQVFGYYRTPWATDGSVVESRTDGSIVRLTRAEWVRAGSPAPRLAPVSYVRTSWAKTVFAEIVWPHHAGDAAVDEVVTLTAAQLRAAGTPTARVVGEVWGTSYFRYASGPRDLYAKTPDGVGKLLTRAERRAAGSPSATRVVAGGYYRAAWSSNVYYLSGAGNKQRMTAKAYAARGKPQVALAPTIYARTPWATRVHALITWPHSAADTAVDQVVHLTAAEYAEAGRPARTLRHRIPGDSFIRLTIGPTIYHRVGGILTPVTTAQWKDAGQPRVVSARPGKPTYIRGILVVNKSLPLPASYGNGLRPELTRSFTKMKAAAKKDGVSLRIISGYRSYATQKGVYARKIRQYGFETAELRSARPGHSEHQTGLTIDVNSVSQAWGKTREGRWVAKNAHKYGFIVRYPAGKTRVTGYAYEPWHLRHVGVGVATHLKKTGLTLDEYLGVTSSYAY